MISLLPPGCPTLYGCASGLSDSGYEGGKGSGKTSLYIYLQIMVMVHDSGGADRHKLSASMATRMAEEGCHALVGDHEGGEVNQFEL